MVIPRKIKGEYDNFSYSFCNEDEVQIDPYTLLGEIFVNVIYIAFNIEMFHHNLQDQFPKKQINE